MKMHWYWVCYTQGVNKKRRAVCAFNKADAANVFHRGMAGKEYRLVGIVHIKGFILD